MQKVIDLPHVRVLVGEVPEGANKIEKCNCIVCSMEEPKLTYLINDEDPQWINLPAGEWQILGTYPSGITEEQAEGIVENNMGPWYNKYYKNYTEAVPWWYTTPLVSLASMFTAHDLPTDKRYAVLVEYK